ncbi:MAG: MFS transporter [Anaerolineales bacterium]|nr:MFS transporter [Anaerolineales bacterium]
MSNHPPETIARWAGLLALFTLAGFIETVFYGQLNAFTPLYLPRLGIAAEDVRVWTGGLASVASAVGIPFLPLWGALADRYARQPVIIRSFLVHLLAAIAMFLAGNIWVFVIGRSLTSLALGNSGLMMATLHERVPERRRGLSFAIMNSAPPVGAVIGPLASGPLVDAWGFRSLLLIDAGLMLLVILALAVGYRDSYRGVSQEPLLRMAAASLGVITSSGRLRALFPTLFFLFSGWTLALTYTPLAVTTLYRGNQPGAAVGAVLGASGLLTLLLGPLVGWLADKVGLWKVFFSGAGLAILLWPLPYFSSNLVDFGVRWALVNGLVSSVFAISFAVLAQSASEKARGRVMAFSFLPTNLGFMIGPAIGSVITRGSIFNVYPAAAILTAIGLGLLWVAWRRPG